MLTDAKARAAKPTGARYELADGKVEGLRLRVGASGKKSWSLLYRHAGEKRRMPIGKGFPTTTVAEARKLARDVLQAVGRGEDPAAKRQADLEALRMVDLLGTEGDGGWYLESYVRTAGRAVDGKTAAKTERGIRTDRGYIEKHLRPRKALLRKRADAVTVADLDAIKAEIRPGAWRKVRDILRVCFRHAEELGAIPAGSNPAARTKATPPRKVERYLTPEERRQLDATLAEAEAAGPRRSGGLNPHLVRLFRLLSLTGMRLGEALELRWEQVDWRHGQLRLPTSKTGAKSVPLTDQALAFLKRERGPVARVGRVCSTADGGRIGVYNVERAWRSVRKRAGIEDVRIHDLRHSWASDAVSAGVPLQVIGAVLGHRSTQTTARYAHLHDQAIREGLAKAGAAIEAATKGAK